MASKNNKEMLHFNNATKARELLINSLNNCTSSERLSEIKNKYKMDKSKAHSPFKAINFTADHAEKIAKLDKKIDELFKSKTIECSKSEIIGSETNEAASKTVSDATLDVSSEEKEQKSVDAEREAKLSLVRANIKNLEDKARDLLKRSGNHHEIDDLYSPSLILSNDNKYEKAAMAAIRISSDIKSLCNNYACNSIDLETLQSQAGQRLEKTNADVSVLSEHRGPKNAVLNLLLAITGIGLIALAVNSIHKGHFTLFKLSKTASTSTVEGLDNSVKNVEEPETYTPLSKV